MSNISGLKIFHRPNLSQQNLNLKIVDRPNQVKLGKKSLRILGPKIR